MKLLKQIQLIAVSKVPFTILSEGKGSKMDTILRKVVKMVNLARKATAYLFPNHIDIVKYSKLTV